MDREKISEHDAQIVVEVLKSDWSNYGQYFHADEQVTSPQAKYEIIHHLAKMERLEEYMMR
jgi:hypothetical protein